MYRRPKFIEILHEIRQEMAADADYDVVLFTEMVRSGEMSVNAPQHKLKFETQPSDRPKEEFKIGEPEERLVSDERI